MAEHFQWLADWIPAPCLRGDKLRGYACTWERSCLANDTCVISPPLLLKGHVSGYTGFAGSVPLMGNDLIQIGSIPPPQDAGAGAGAAQDMPLCAETASDARKFYIETFGCQMNAHDSEKVAGVLLARGYRPADSYRDADIILYNTCSIREKAAQKVFSRLGAFRKGRTGEGKIIGVLGCVAQQEGERFFERAPQVSLVCGSASYAKLPDLLAQLDSGKRRVSGLKLDTVDCFETELARRSNPYRAYLTIIEGCDQRCAFCVVPMTRGPERSRSSAKILAECRQLVDEGYTEIQLLGQIVNAWQDPSPARWSFAELLARVSEVAGVRRVRFATSHPRFFTAEIVQALDSNPVLCDQIHLPAQSGSTEVLSRMRRGYARDEYLEKIHCIRKAQRAISLSTDIIVGFCGESEEDFERTLSLLAQVEYDQVFSFKFSPRPTTAALGFSDTVSEEEKRRRLAVLQELQRQIQLRRNQMLVGQVLEVLVEGFQPRLVQAVGRTTSNRVLNFPGEPADIGCYIPVQVTSAGPNSLVGKRVTGEHDAAAQAERRAAWKSR